MGELSVVPITSAPVRVVTPEAQLAAIKALALDTLESPGSRRVYDLALDEYIRWVLAEDIPPFQKSSINAHRMNLRARGLSASTINLHLCAIRKLAAEAADNGFLDQSTAAAALRVKGDKRKGVRTGNWLPHTEAERLLNAPDIHTVKGIRDTAILAVLLGCGLRRSELAALEYRHIQQREGRWVILDIVGKGGRVRTVPMPHWCKAAIDQWHTAIGVETDRVFVQLSKAGRPRGARSLSDSGIYQIVLAYAARVGVTMAPHDLRRTFAKLAHKGNAALEQIQLTLGHASIQTTERYLGVRQDLADAPCDHLSIRIRRGS